MLWNFFYCMINEVSICFIILTCLCLRLLVKVARVWDSLSTVTFRPLISLQRMCYKKCVCWWLAYCIILNPTYNAAFWWALHR